MDTCYIMYPFKITILHHSYAINISYGTTLPVCIWCVCT